MPTIWFSYATSAQEAEQALKIVRQWMQQVNLQLHPEKTRVVNLEATGSYFDFLGYRFKRTRRSDIAPLVRPRSQPKLRASIRRYTRRCNKHSMQTIIEQINPTIRGWFGYFKHVRRTRLKEMDGWVRMRLRSIYRKRHRKRGRGRGSDHHRWPNQHFAELGLFSLEAAQSEALASIKGVKH